MPRNVIPIRRLAAATLIIVAPLGPATRAAERSTDPADSDARHLSAPGIGGLGHGAQGFVVAPTRIVFEGRQRHATLTLANTGSEPAAYRVSLQRMRMSVAGEISPVDGPEPGEAFADTLVRFSPRQFEVAPRSFQVVRLQLRAPAGLPDGEYRSHLVIQEIPRLAPEGVFEPSADGIAIRLTPVFGTAIPVIVRQGQTSVQVSFADVRYRSPASSGGRPSVSFKLVRDGMRSVYGDLECLVVRSGHPPRTIGGIKGVAVYTPNRERLFDILLESNPAALGDSLRVRFSETTLHAGCTAESTLAAR